ncbi:MAG: hypothetical protein JSU01_18715 [Bacteroidetes bacterium]|nr:hypothetical protein [Bacteroidota bacterium]
MTNTFEQGYQPDSYVNTTAVFGEVKRDILSKDFKLGNIANVFGKTVLNFSGADINGTAVVEMNQVFGEVVILVPVGWHVVNEISNVFAELVDKRMNPTLNINNGKVLILKGVSIFAAIKVVNGF